MQVCSYVGAVLVGLLGLAGVAGGCSSSSPPPAESPSSEGMAADTDMAGVDEAPADTSADTTADDTSDAPAPAGSDGAGADSSAADSSAAADGSGAGSGDGGRNLAAVQKLVSDNRKPVRECYLKARKELPDLKGTLTIKFVIDPEGNVKSAELNPERSDIKSPDVVNCAIATIKSLKFPASAKGMETTVNYPYNFKP